MKKTKVQKSLIIGVTSLAMIVNAGTALAAENEISVASEQTVQVDETASTITDATYGQASLVAPVIEAESVEKEYIVVLKKKGKKLGKMRNGKLPKVKRQFRAVSAVTVKASSSDIQEIKADPNVDHVEENIKFSAVGGGFTIQSATSEVSQWDLQQMNATTAWSDGYTGAGVKVAVLDTGIATHTDLSIAGGYSAVDYTTSYADDEGHGTHVAGTIAALRNSTGMVGVAPNASLYGVKVLGADGQGNLADIIEGMDWAIQNGMNIINMSLGTATGSQLLEDMVNNAVSHGIVVVASSGNNGAADGSGDTILYPARYASVIAVAAVDNSKVRGSFSATGPKNEFAAPGVAVVSTYLNNGFASASGTSQAAPHVSGLLALLKQKNPSMTVAELRNELKKYAEDLGTPGRDDWYGYGLVSYKQLDVTAPAEVTGLTVVGKTTTSLTVEFTKPNDADYDKANVYVNGVLQGSTQTNQFEVVGLTSDTDNPIVVKTVDTTGNESAGVTVTGHTDAMPVNDTTAPAEVTGLAVTSKTTSSLTIGFTKPNDADYAKSNVYVNGSLNGSTTTGDYNVIGLADDTAYTIVVKTVDTTGNESVGVTVTGHTDANPVVDTTAPAEVTGLAVTAKTTTSLTVGFVKPSDADFAKSNVYVNGVLSGSTTDESYNVVGLTDDTAYSIVVKTVDTAGNESIGVSVTGHTNANPVVDTTAPAEVTGLAVTAKTTTSLTVGFTKPNDADYAKSNVYVNGSLNGSTTTGDYNVIGLADDTAYTIVVKTVDTTGNESVGVTVTGHTNAVPVVDTTAPAEVTGLAVTAKTTSSLTVGFTKPNDADYAKANVYVNGSLNGSTAGESYDVVGLTDDTAYTIVVKTVDTTGNESVGATVTGRTNAVVVAPVVDTTAPAEVTGLAVTSKTTSSLTVGFTKPNDADFAKSNVYVNGSLNGSTTTGDYNVIGLSDDTSYTIVVKTVDTTGNESVGVTVTGRTDAVVVPPVVDATAPAEVTGLAVTSKTTSSLTVGFTKPNDADYAKSNVYVNGSLNGSTTTGDYNVIGLADDTAYTIVVKTVDTTGNESVGATVTGRTNAVVIPPVVDATAPAEVTGLAVTAKTTSSLTIGFTKPGDADYAKVNVYIGGVLKGSTTTGSYEIVGLTADQLYSIVVKTVDMTGNESVGVTVTGRTNAVVIPPVVDATAPAEVTGLAVTAKTTSSLTIGFTKPGDADYAKANVYVNGVLNGSTTTGSYEAIGLTDDTSYTIVVKTVDTTGNESVGVTVTGRTKAILVVDTTAPAEVTGLAVTAKTTSSLTVGFVKPNDADYAKSNVYVNGVLNGTTTSGSYQAVGLSADTVYPIVVKTVDTAGNESAGVTVTDRTDATVISTPPTTGDSDHNDSNSGSVDTHNGNVTVPAETPVAPPATPEPVKDSTPTPVIIFKDVEKHWAKETVEWATSIGLVKGFDDGSFKPDAKVTESQFLAMILRLYNPHLDEQTDPLPAGAFWATKYYGIAKDLNLPVGGMDNLDNTAKPITRLQVAEMVAATRGFNLKGDDLVSFMYENGYANGSDPTKKTIASFHPEDKLTRAEAVQFLKNLADKFDGKLLKRPDAPSDTTALPEYPKK